MFKIDKGNKGVIIFIIRINSPFCLYTYIKALFISYLYNLKASLFITLKGIFI